MAASPKLSQSIVRNMERSVKLAKRLRCLNMFITETFDDALERAEQLESTGTTASNAFFGTPLVVKDNFSTANVKTTCASGMLANYVPPYTATVVQKLLNCGAIMLGKTNMDEFSMGASSTDSYYAPVKNPWTLKVLSNKRNSDDPPFDQLNRDWHLTGGSSGGSAAAVACGIAKVAFGSDTGGSTRNPAALCGIVGLKPTYGLLSRHGLVPLVNSLDVPGIMTRTVDDAAAALNILAGFDVNDSTTVDRPLQDYTLDELPDIRSLTIGLPKEYHRPDLSPEVVQWWRAIAGLLERVGSCRLKEVSLPHTELSIVCYHVLGECEIASNMARYDGIEYGFRAEDQENFNKLLAVSRSESFNEVVRRRILAGNFFLLKNNYEEYYVKALKVRRLIAEDFYGAFREDERKVDILLTPATLTDAPLYSEWKGTDDGHSYQRERKDDFFTQPVNMAGVSAITIPVALSNRGLPISLQLIADKFEEKKLLAVAKWIEKTVQFAMLDGESLCWWEPADS